MRASIALLVSLASVSIAGSAGAERSGLPSLSVASGIVQPGGAVVVRVAGAAPMVRLRIYLQAYPLVGRRLVFVGSVVPARPGPARFDFRLPVLRAGVYRPVAFVASRLVAGRGLLSVAARAPAGFGPLGASGCSPPSPSSGHDLFATAAGTELWALPFAAAGEPGAAALTGVVGKETKIVFRMTSGIPRVFYSVAPDGTRVAPIWMEPHVGSNWNRPGAEWGAGFVFDTAGCWRIHAGTAPSFGDLWLSVVS
jgi:hypothetical protein